MNQKPKHTEPTASSQSAAYGYEHKYVGGSASHSVTPSHTMTKLKLSSFWITDASGNVNQYLAYTSTRLSTGLPFGELRCHPERSRRIDQRAKKHNIRFKFTGKEWDAETGFDYFGARYYSSDLSVWLSACHPQLQRRRMDPLADKYPPLSPYMYTAGNPVMLVVPDGRKIWISGLKKEYSIGMKYSGDNKFVKGVVGSLNKIGSTKIGKKVLSNLIVSEDSFNISQGGNGSYKNDNSDGGKSGGTVKTGGSTVVGLLAHELFHAYQSENNQGGRSIHNEIEAYLFQDAVILEVGCMSSSFKSSKDRLNKKELPTKSKLYEKLVRDLLWKDDEKSLEKVQGMFKGYPGANLPTKKKPNGTYSTYPLQRANQKESLIKGLYPLIL